MSSDTLDDAMEMFRQTMRRPHPSAAKVLFQHACLGTVIAFGWGFGLRFSTYLMTKIAGLRGEGEMKYRARWVGYTGVGIL